MSRAYQITVASAVALVIASTGSAALAASHEWRFNEVFSNADGTIQFIELRESAGADNETFLDGKWILSDATDNQYDFTEDIDPPTGNKYLLLATADFAALSGAPTPDYIIPDNFFSLGADTLRYWLYGAAIMTWPAGGVPTDGIHSRNVNGSIGVNSPTNYAGDSGSVAAGVPIPAVSHWGVVVMLLLMLTAGSVIATSIRQRSSGVTAF